MTDDLQLSEIAPSASGAAARIAAFELLVMQDLSALVAQAPSRDAKQTLTRAAAAALARHEAAVQVLEDLGAAVGRELSNVAGEFGEFSRRTQGRDWDERVASIVLAGGILRDFLQLLVEEFEPQPAGLAAALDDAETIESLNEILTARFQDDPRLSDRIALWGRRLTGDALLAVRRALGIPAGLPADRVVVGAEALLERLGSKLMAEHSRRMNRLGLAA